MHVQADTQNQVVWLIAGPTALAQHATGLSIANDDVIRPFHPDPQIPQEADDGAHAGESGQHW